MNPKLLLALGVLAAGLAWAGPCADADVVLEVERPPAVLGGAEFELAGDVLTFSDGACLEAGGAAMTAARIVYDRAAGTLRAEAVSGSIAGWTFRAPRLVGEGAALVLEAAVFERGDAVVHAAAARFEDGAVALTQVAARTPRYRFRAARGRLEGEAFVAEEVRSTPCKCGNALELAARRAAFRFQEGELVLQQGTFRLYGAALARPERLRLELDRPLDLRFPLRLSYGAGWNFGVEGLPLPAPGEAFGRWSTRLTLLAEGVGGGLAPGKTEAVRFAVEHASPGRTLRFGLRPARTWDGAAWRARVEPDVRLTDGPLDFRIGWSPALGRTVASFALAERFDVGGLELTPFARLADEENRGLSLGAHGKLRVADGRIGPLEARLDLPYAAALYPDAGPYAWGGGRLEVAVERAFRLRAEAHRPWGAPRFGYEARSLREGLELRLGDGVWLQAEYARTANYDLAGGVENRYDLSYRIEAGAALQGYRGRLSGSHLERRTPAGSLLDARQTWRFDLGAPAGAFAAEWRRGWDAAWSPTYSEFWASFVPPEPGCAGGWTLAPSLGWDLLRGRVSRVGVELTLNDCCFAWTLGYEGVFVPQRPGEAAGQSVRFGVRLR